MQVDAARHVAEHPGLMPLPHLLRGAQCGAGLNRAWAGCWSSNAIDRRGHVPDFEWYGRAQLSGMRLDL